MREVTETIQRKLSTPDLAYRKGLFDANSDNDGDNDNGGDLVMAGRQRWWWSRQARRYWRHDATVVMVVEVVVAVVAPVMVGVVTGNDGSGGERGGDSLFRPEVLK